MKDSIISLRLIIQIYLSLGFEALRKHLNLVPQADGNHDEKEHMGHHHRKKRSFDTLAVLERLEWVSKSSTSRVLGGKFLGTKATFPLSYPA